MNISSSKYQSSFRFIIRHVFDRNAICSDDYSGTVHVHGSLPLQLGAAPLCDVSDKKWMMWHEDPWTSHSSPKRLVSQRVTLYSSREPSGSIPFPAACPSHAPSAACWVRIVSLPKEFLCPLASESSRQLIRNRNKSLIDEPSLSLFCCKCRCFSALLHTWEEVLDGIITGGTSNKYTHTHLFFFSFCASLFQTRAQKMLDKNRTCSLLCSSSTFWLIKRPWRLSIKTFFSG